MDLSQTIWSATLAVAIYAGFIDWRTRRIPNWLTVSGFFLGIVLNSILQGWRGAVVSLEGAGLALGLLLPLVLLRGFGAGDWKLLGALGALMGWRAMLVVLVISCLLSGAAALIQIVLTRRVMATLKNILLLLQGFVVSGLRPNPQVSLDNPTLAKLPFGTAVAAATALCFVATHWLR
ncbi:MAG: A24 family peptidase [Candidatus Acidiferrales bacterium]